MNRPAVQDDGFSLCCFVRAATSSLAERRGKPGAFVDEVWDEALAMLQAVGYKSVQTGAVLVIRKR